MKKHIIILGTLFLLSGHSKAQPSPAKSLQEVSQTILHLDSLFWQAYNTCDTDKMATFFTEDLEFYHDKGGLTTSLNDLMTNTRKGMCGNENWRLRREAVAGSYQVFSLDNYGAILSGEHVFYIIEKGKPERLDGLAKFTHVWRFKDNAWKMHRILSYDHGPASRKNIKKEIALSDAALKKFEGKYEGPKTGPIMITVENSALKITAGNFQSFIYPEAENLFFHKERDLRFEFIYNDKAEVVEMVVWENGEVAERIKKVK